MATLSKPAKFLLIGSALLLLALLLVRPLQVSATPDQATSSSDGWVCDWLDEPTISHSGVRNQCRGVVQCRHGTMRTFVPQIRKVTCPIQGSDCDPTTCFTRSVRMP